MWSLCSILICLQPQWYSLESRKTGKKKSLVTGEVLLGFSVYDPIHTSATQQQILQKFSGMVSAGIEGDSDLDHAASHADGVEPDEEEDDDEGVAGESEDLNQPSDTAEKRKRRVKLARLKKKAKQRAYEFTGFSDLAGVLFLEISNIVDLPPERNSKFTKLLASINFRQEPDNDQSDKNILRHGSLCGVFAWEENI